MSAAARAFGRARASGSRLSTPTQRPARTASVKTGGPEFEFTAPKALFKTRILRLEGSIYHEYDVSPDGQKFLIGTLIGDTKAAPPTRILNWTAMLKK